MALHSEVLVNKMDTDDLLRNKEFRRWLSRLGFNVSKIRENFNDEQIESLWYSFQDETLAEED